MDERADSLQRSLEDSARCGNREMQPAMPAGKLDAMRLACMVESPKPGEHGRKSTPDSPLKHA